MNDNALYPASLRDAVALGFSDVRDHKCHAISNLYTAIRNRLKAPDTTNMHDPIIMHPVIATPSTFEATFTDPATGTRCRMTVVRIHGAQ